MPNDLSDSYLGALVPPAAAAEDKAVSGVKMSLRGLFPTPLVTLELDSTGALSAQLRTAVLAQEARNPGTTHSNLGGWQSEGDLGSWAGAAGVALINAARQLADAHTMLFHENALIRQPIDWRVRAWANVNRTGHANHLHFHPGAYWSAVYYVDDGGIAGSDHLGGALHFHDPRGPAPLLYAPEVKMAIDGCLGAGLGELFYPRTGQLVLFPSWLGHSVDAYRGDQTRISIAINLSVS